MLPSLGRLGQFLTRTESVLCLMNSEPPPLWSWALSLTWGLDIGLPVRDQLTAGILWGLSSREEEGLWRDGALKRVSIK